MGANTTFTVKGLRVVEDYHEVSAITEDEAIEVAIHDGLAIVTEVRWGRKDEAFPEDEE